MGCPTGEQGGGTTTAGASSTAVAWTGVVPVDGARPHDRIDEVDVERMRALWRRLGWLVTLLRPVGLAPRMSAEQVADSGIEVGEIARERALGPVLDGIVVPTRCVNASGSSLGSKGDEQERIRASPGGVVGRNPNIRISAKVPSNRGAVPRKDFRAVAAAVREVAALDRVARWRWGSAGGPLGAGHRPRWVPSTGTRMTMTPSSSQASMRCAPTFTGRVAQQWKSCGGRVRRIVMPTRSRSTSPPSGRTSWLRTSTSRSSRRTPVIDVVIR
ncbi:MAG TPA: hypothetical protein VFZ92_28390 [Umezawaea sp.]